MRLISASSARSRRRRLAAGGHVEPQPATSQRQRRRERTAAEKPQGRRVRRTSSREQVSLLRSGLAAPAFAAAHRCPNRF
jgi:hypothetical protein